MEHTLKRIQAYLGDVLGETPPLTPWNGGKQLPFYLQDAYRFYALALLGQECLLMVPVTDEAIKPASLKKHWQQLRKRQSLPVCLGVNHLASYDRRHLIEQGVPFIAANKQLFLLPLGIDLRERFAQAPPVGGALLSPAAQVLLLRTLYHPKWLQGLTAAPLAQLLGYTAMTISRAVRELERHQLLAVERIGRGKYLCPPEEPAAVWRRAKPLLRNPMIRQIFGSTEDKALNEFPLFVAGESALAEKTMLSGPKIATFALATKLWPTVKRALWFDEAKREELGTLTIELWHYDPLLLTEDRCVDTLSLILSLQHVRDERVEMALEQLEGQLSWLR